MSDIGPIPAKDQTNYLLGRLEGALTALTNTVSASATAQGITNAQHEAEHAEFRRTLTEHASELAVLKNDKTVAVSRRSESVAKWVSLIGIPVALVGSFASWLLSNHL